MQNIFTRLRKKKLSKILDCSFESDTDLEIKRLFLLFSLKYAMVIVMLFNI